MIEKIQRELRQGRSFLGFAALKACGFGLFFVVPLVLAGILSPAGFGSYSLGMMIVYLFAAILIASSKTPFVVYAREEQQRSDKINKSFSVRFAFVIFAFLFFTFFSFVLMKPLTTLTLISASQFPFLIFAYFGVGLRFFFENLFLALNKKIEHAIYELLTGIISIIYLLVLYTFFTITLEGIFVMFFVSSLLAFVLLMHKINLKEIFPLEFDKKTFWGMFDYTKWSMVGAVSLYFINWGDNIILRLFVSLEEIGTYNFAYQFFKGILMLTTTISTYYLPFISQNINNKNKIYDYLFRKRIKILIASIAASLLLFYIVPYFIDIFYGTKYEGSILVFRILLLGSVFALYRVFYSPIFNSLKRYKFTQIAEIGYVTCNLALDYILVPHFGIMGAAIATTFTYAVMAITSEIYFRKYCRKAILPS